MNFAEQKYRARLARLFNDAEILFSVDRAAQGIVYSVPTPDGDTHSVAFAKYEGEPRLAYVGPFYGDAQRALRVRERPGPYRDWGCSEHILPVSLNPLTGRCPLKQDELVPVPEFPTHTTIGDLTEQIPELHAPGVAFDTALPLDWTDEYSDLMGGHFPLEFVWIYVPGSAFGRPFPLTEEARHNLQLFQSRQQALK